ncbi:MAG: stage 0 sporulation family protein [Clostridia bacterium]|jgi:cell fate regulator YaaT (PSP1 superfamily)|nr:stage 0 sporulation family protein [Clostridia bacterium]MDD4276157.1 stage 0 sporulation family protein [Clostridia bacterium]
MAKVVGVKFNSACKIYYFDPVNLLLKVSDRVVVETQRGIEMGEIVFANKEMESTPEQLKPIIRIADAKDLQAFKDNLAKRGEAIEQANLKIKNHDLKMKLLDAEFTLDGSKVIFSFSADDRVDFRELVKDLAMQFKMRIELRQVGIRDEARILGGYGPCGRECCCITHLEEFERVSVKMAKVQGLPLNPQKISGLCGRLMCCLEYENPYYIEVFKEMPKINSIVETPEGTGTVAYNNLLKKIVTVRIVADDDSVSFKEFSLSDINAKEKMQAEEILDDKLDVLPDTDTAKYQ